MVHYILRCLCQSISLPFFSNGHYPFLAASQSDNLLSYLTVEETLTFTAQLALRQHSESAIRKKVISYLSHYKDWESYNIFTDLAEHEFQSFDLYARWLLLWLN